MQVSAIKPHGSNVLTFSHSSQLSNLFMSFNKFYQEIAQNRLHTEQKKSYRHGELSAYLDILQDCRKEIFNTPNKKLSSATESAQFILGRLTDLQLSEYGYMQTFSHYQEIGDILKSATTDPLSAWLDNRVEQILSSFSPDIVILSAAFLSQLLPSLRLAKTLKQASRGIHISLGGALLQAHGQELIKQPSLFEHIDSLVVGAGEPALDEILSGQAERTNNLPALLKHNINLRSLPIPNWEGLPLHAYLNPEFHLGLTSCFGCWWGRCVFCSYGNIKCPPIQKSLLS